MFYNIYGDAELSGESVTATVGVYRSASVGMVGRWTNPTYTIEEVSVPSNSLYGAYSASISAQSDQVGNVWLPPGFEYTDTYKKQYFYISSNMRFEYYYWSSGGQRKFSWPRYEILQGNQWVQQVIENHTESVVASIEGFRLTILPKNKGTFDVYHNDKGDMLCIDVAYRSISDPSSISYWYCACGIAPYDKILVDDYINSYKPKKSVRKGGRGSGTLRRGTIPSLPISSINTVLMASCQGYGNGLTYYKLKGDALSNLTRALYPTIKTSDKSAAARREALIGIMAIPYDVTTTPNATDIIYLADENVYCNDTECDFCSALLVSLNFGTFTFEGQMEDTFADIIYATYNLYLPGVGTVNIDPATCAQGKVSVTGGLDIRNGNIIYQVCTQSGSDDGWCLYGHYSGNVGTQIPISGVGGGGSVMGMIQTAGQIAAGAGMIAVGVAGANPLAAVTGVSQLASGIEKGIDQATMYPMIDHANALDAQIGGLCSPGVRMMISRNRMINPIDYKHLVGVPSAGAVDASEQPVSQISDFSGLTVITDIDISAISCTAGEKAEILRLLREGVIL